MNASQCGKGRMTWGFSIFEFGFSIGAWWIGFVLSRREGGVRGEKWVFDAEMRVWLGLVGFELALFCRRGRGMEPQMNADTRRLMEGSDA